MEIMVDYLGVANYKKNTSICKPSMITLSDDVWTDYHCGVYSWNLMLIPLILLRPSGSVQQSCGKTPCFVGKTSTIDRWAMFSDILDCQIRPLATDLLSRCFFMSAIPSYVEQADLWWDDGWSNTVSVSRSISIHWISRSSWIWWRFPKMG